MRVWVMHGIHDGELFTSTHLTEKGAALAAIADVLDFVGVTDEESALDAIRRHHLCVETGEKQSEIIEWEFEKMKDMTRKELWKIFGDWSELTWDNSYGYKIDVSNTEIGA